MDLIRDSVFFTTLLHCVLASPLPQTNYMNQNYNPYDVSPIPEKGTLQTPSYDNIPETKISGTPPFLVTPSWLYKPIDNPNLPDKVQENNNQSGSYKPKLPGTAHKAIGMKYPLAVPRVKLGIRSGNGMLPVKIQNKTEPPKVLKPSSEVSTKPVVNNRLVGIVKLIKNVNNTLTKPKVPNPNQKKSKKPAQPDENELKLAKFDYSSIIDYILHGKPLKVYQHTSAPKEWPGLVLNPRNYYYPSTSPGFNYEDILKALQYTPMYKEYSDTEALRLTNFDYPPANPNVYAENKPEKESYKTYMPEVPKPIRYPAEKRLHGSLSAIQRTPPNLPVPVLKQTNFDYYLSKPGVDNTTGIELPPVPTSMSIVRRTQLALMNTVAGLPGGSAQTLNSIRAG